MQQGIAEGDSPRSEVTIVLAAFNGQEYIRAQIESIRGQSHQNWKLLIRDDDSCDRTVGIVKSLAREDSRIELLSDEHGWLGASQNFGTLAEAAHRDGAQYLFFADQDDVWHPHKISRQLKLMQQTEAQTEPGTPLLAHSDLAVVDANLQMIHPSFMDYEGLSHRSQQPLKTLLVQNFVTGCTVMANRALLDWALPIPPEAVMHDWWMALCAATVGELRYLPETTVRYRQHEHNCVGAKTTQQHIGRILASLPDCVGRHTANLTGGITQAQIWLRRLEASPRSENDQTQFLQQFCQRFSGEQGKLKRVSRVLKLGVHRQTRLKQLSLLLQLPLVPALPQ